MSKRDIGTGWIVVDVEDTRGTREGDHGEEVARTMPEECDIKRCECCARRIYIVVHMRRGAESLMLGQGCAREAGYSVPQRSRAAKPKPAPMVVAAPRIGPAAAPADPCPQIAAADYTTPDGDVDLLALCAAIGIATPAWT